MERLLKWFILICLTICFPFDGQASNQIPDTCLIPVDKRIRIGKLENGLTYYLRYNNWPENRVCFYLTQRVGSLQEEDNQRGLAHFLEHMCFNGSEHFSGNGIDRFFERLGAQDEVNAIQVLKRRFITSTTSPLALGRKSSIVV